MTYDDMCVYTRADALFIRVKKSRALAFVLHNSVKNSVETSAGRQIRINPYPDD